MSSVNSVNIYSIDEERLKFRVCIGINARRLALAPVVGYGRDYLMISRSRHPSQTHMNIHPVG